MGIPLPFDRQLRPPLALITLAGPAVIFILFTAAAPLIVNFWSGRLQTQSRSLREMQH